MKSLVSKVVMSAAVLMAGFTTAAAQNDFYTNVHMDGQNASERTIYKYDGYLTPHLKYDYTYNADNKMSSRTAYLWLDAHNEWIPYYRIDYTYENGKVNMKYGVWDAMSGNFSKYKEHASYEATGDNDPQW